MNILGIDVTKAAILIDYSGLLLLPIYIAGFTRKLVIEPDSIVIKRCIDGPLNNHLITICHRYITHFKYLKI